MGNILQISKQKLALIFIQLGYYCQTILQKQKNNNYA